ncbi:MAG: DUF6340 family protein [Bacteroidales bacterium]|jgi:hypothetical protein|nr:DUF6340 family protein [Bacteroidales bacterium]
MMNKIHIVLYCLICLAPACASIRECRIETLQPPEMPLNTPIEKIAVYAPPKLFSEAIVSNIKTADIASDSLIYNILYSLKMFIEEAPGFEESVVSVFIADGDIPDKADYDWLIELKQLDIENNIGAQSGKLFLHARCSALWTLQNRDASVTDTRSDNDSQIWLAISENDGNYIISYLPTIADAWWDLGIAIARSYARYITPYWYTEDRQFFMLNKFPDHSRRAYDAMMNGNYQKAFDIWEEMLILCGKNGKTSTKSQITLNMAVACESEHRLDEALVWAQRSVGYAVNYLNGGYPEFLKYRQEQDSLLRRQISH